MAACLVGVVVPVANVLFVIFNTPFVSMNNLPGLLKLIIAVFAISDLIVLLSMFTVAPFATCIVCPDS